MTWLGHVLGLDNASGAPYLFWSGFAADVPMFVGLAVWLRRHNCHQHRCLRIGRHPVDGTTWVVCRRHHPESAPKAVDIASRA